MMPVPAYDAVRYAWLRIESQGFILYGFLLYTHGDKPFFEYMDGPGLADLDSWTGEDCAVFVMQTPSSEWIEYTNRSKHSWWRVFGEADKDIQESMRSALSRFEQVEFTIDGERRSLSTILAPPLNKLLFKDEVETVLERFGCRPTDHPCLLLFRTLRDRDFWHVSFDELLGTDVHQLRLALKDWFGGVDFKRILSEARRA